MEKESTLLEFLILISAAVMLIQGFKITLPGHQDPVNSLALYPQRSYLPVRRPVTSGF